jgi:hypothetical protein
MKTAVQLRHPAGNVHPRAELLSGTPCAVISTALGPVALIGPGEGVAYRIRYRRRTRVFVFRALDVDDPLAASVPGVRQHVELLLELGTRGRTRLVRGRSAYLAKNAHDPSSLPDAFYVRVGVVLAGRLPTHKILVSLLAQSTSAPAVGDPGPPELALHLHLHERAAEGERPWNTEGTSMISSSERTRAFTEVDAALPDDGRVGWARW